MVVFTLFATMPPMSRLCQACCDLHPGLCRTSDKNMFKEIYAAAVQLHRVALKHTHRELVGTCCAFTASGYGGLERKAYHILCNVRSPNPTVLVFAKLHESTDPISSATVWEIKDEQGGMHPINFLTSFALLKSVWYSWQEEELHRVGVSARKDRQLVLKT